MTDKTIARRYAKALFAIGEEQGKTGAYAKDLEGLYAELAKEGELAEVLDSHFIATSSKKEVVKKTCSSFDPMVQNFICLILDKGRNLYLKDICRIYFDLIDEAENILHAEVRSAVPLSDQQMVQIEAKFSALTGQKVKAELAVDPTLLGGVSVTVGDKVYDGTIAHQLKLMEHSLKETEMLR